MIATMREIMTRLIWDSMKYYHSPRCARGMRYQKSPFAITILVDATILADATIWAGTGTAWEGGTVGTQVVRGSVSPQ